jgi:hypothetical protein
VPEGEGKQEDGDGQGRRRITKHLGETMSTKPFLTRRPEAVPPGPETANEQKTAWSEMDKAAYYGLAGDFVKALEPHTEADPVGLLIQFLVAFGSIVGAKPYYLVENDKHRANLYAVLVGDSARGRKGTGAPDLR